MANTALRRRTIVNYPQPYGICHDCRQEFTGGTKLQLVKKLNVHECSVEDFDPAADRIVNEIAQADIRGPAHK
jgi:hypothetical protein